VTRWYCCRVDLSMLQASRTYYMLIQLLTACAGKRGARRNKSKTTTREADEDSVEEESEDEDDAESDTTSADEGDDVQEGSDGSQDDVTTELNSAGALTSCKTQGRLGDTA